MEWNPRVQSYKIQEKDTEYIHTITFETVDFKCTIKLSGDLRPLFNIGDVVALGLNSKIAQSKLEGASQ